jgi:hypothetical protein
MSFHYKILIASTPIFILGQEGWSQMPEHIPLTPIEQEFADKLQTLFARVQPQKPEKGIAALLKRARNKAKQTDQPMELILEEIYKAAVERTERRIQLLSQCSLRSSARNETKP